MLHIPWLRRRAEQPKLQIIANGVVLDIDGDQSGLAQIQDSIATFHVDLDDDVEKTGSIVAADALLVPDRSRDGVINGMFETSLAGIIGSSRNGLPGLDTVSLSGEAASNLPEEVRGGNTANSAGSFVPEDGTGRTLFDAGFAYERQYPEPDVVRSGKNPTYASPDEQKMDGAGHDVGSIPPPASIEQSGETSITSGEAVNLEMGVRSMIGRSSKYSLNAGNGQLIMSLNEADGVMDPRAGLVGPATLLSFRDKTIGILSPLILDLDGDGLELKSRRKSQARFDMDGNGSSDDTGWVGKDDGFLVIDSNGDGKIGSNAELSLLGLKADARSSLDALSVLDSDRNGQINAKDARFGELKIWRDRNGNGVTDAGELKTLGDHGIASIDLSAQATAATKVKPGASTIFATSTFTRTDGSMGSVGDAALAFKPAASGTAASQDPLTLPTEDGLFSGLQSRIEALRMGLGRNGFSERGLGHAFSLPAEIDPFDFFQRPPEEQVAPDAPSAAAGENFQRTQDLPAEPLDTATDFAEAPLSPPSLNDLRLAHMVQQMASFGVRSGEGEWNDRSNPQVRFDYFAP